MAPELSTNSKYGHSIDIFSFSMILYQLLFGRHELQPLGYVYTHQQQSHTKKFIEL